MVQRVFYETKERFVVDIGALEEVVLFCKHHDFSRSTRGSSSWPRDHIYNLSIPILTSTVSPVIFYRPTYFALLQLISSWTVFLLGLAYLSAENGFTLTINPPHLFSAESG